MDPGEIPSDDDQDQEEDYPMIPEPVVEITEAHQDYDNAILDELECLKGLKSVVGDKSADKQLKVVLTAQKEIEALNEISSDLQKALHMEKAKNLQLKQKVEKCMKPPLAPIKIKISNGKTILSKWFYLHKKYSFVEKINHSSYWLKC